jgi:very-short-patch-repair endonuclease
LAVHQLGGFAPSDAAVVDAIPVTSPTRTLIDLASVLHADVLEEALDEALRRRLTTVRRLQWRLAQLGTRGRQGAGTLAKFAEARAGTRTPESRLETRFLRLLRRAKLPLPVPQHEIRDHSSLIARVDFAFPDVGLAIEVDSHRWHSSRARWEHDLARRNALTSLGWRIIHVTSTDLAGRANEIIRIVTSAVNR